MMKLRRTLSVAERLKPFDVLATFVLFWLITVIGMSIFADGFFYHMKQPVPVTKISNDSVTLKFTRYSRFTMDSYGIRELDCTPFSYSYGRVYRVIEGGHREFSAVYEIPSNADINPPCKITGIVIYSPIGYLGPRLSYKWESEKFSIQSSEIITRVETSPTPDF